MHSMKAKALILRFRAEIMYLIVGGMTTVVNFAVYYLCKEWLALHYALANALAWVVAVLFAYAMNRRWVFESQNPAILRELWAFTLSRIFSLLLEMALLSLAVEFIGMDDMLAKVCTSVVVVVCNYITGEWVVFRRK